MIQVAKIIGTGVGILPMRYRSNAYFVSYIYAAHWIIHTYNGFFASICGIVKLVYFIVLICMRVKVPFIDIFRLCCNINWTMLFKFFGFLASCRKNKNLLIVLNTLIFRIHKKLKKFKPYQFFLIGLWLDCWSFDLGIGESWAEMDVSFFFLLSLIFYLIAGYISLLNFTYFYLTNYKEFKKAHPILDKVINSILLICLFILFILLVVCILYCAYVLKRRVSRYVVKMTGGEGNSGFNSGTSRSGGGGPNGSPDPGNNSPNSGVFKSNNDKNKDRQNWLSTVLESDETSRYRNSFPFVQEEKKDTDVFAEVLKKNIGKKLNSLDINFHDSEAIGISRTANYIRTSQHGRNIFGQSSSVGRSQIHEEMIAKIEALHLNVPKDYKSKYIGTYKQHNC